MVLDRQESAQLRCSFMIEDTRTTPLLYFEFAFDAHWLRCPSNRMKINLQNVLQPTCVSPCFFWGGELGSIVFSPLLEGWTSLFCCWITHFLVYCVSFGERQRFHIDVLASLSVFLVAQVREGKAAISLAE